jgi:undecaprenyl-diphosphatase
MTPYAGRHAGPLTGAIARYRDLMRLGKRRSVTQDAWTPALSPPWAFVTGGVASFVVALVAAAVWRTRWPGSADAEMMRWQEAASAWGDGIATAISYAVGPLVVLAVGVSAVLARRVKRWDAVLLSVVTAPGALAIELLLKQLVHRQRPYASTALLYPSGHVAVATAAAVTAVLVLRATSAPPRTRVRVAWLAGWLVLVIAVARLVQTVHYVTDVVGGAALGLAVTCWAALAITVGCSACLPMAARSRLPGRRGASPDGMNSP